MTLRFIVGRILRELIELAERRRGRGAGRRAARRAAYRRRRHQGWGPAGARVRRSRSCVGHQARTRKSIHLDFLQCSPRQVRPESPPGDVAVTPDAGRVH